jgi:hypothetical protein
MYAWPTHSMARATHGASEFLALVESGLCLVVASRDRSVVTFTRTEDAHVRRLNTMRFNARGVPLPQGETRGADIERLDAQIAKLRKEVRNASEGIAMSRRVAPVPPAPDPATGREEPRKHH